MVFIALLKWWQRVIEWRQSVREFHHVGELMTHNLDFMKIVDQIQTENNKVEQLCFSKSALMMIPLLGPGMWNVVPYKKPIAGLPC